MLELGNVSKTVAGMDRIRDVSLTLRHGSLNVLLGPTLSGKTSLMRLMARPDAPTSGAVWMDGTDVTGVAVQKCNVAMIYQQFINVPDYPKLAQLWWQAIGEASSGATTAQSAMDSLSPSRRRCSSVRTCRAISVRSSPKSTISSTGTRTPSRRATSRRS